MVFNKVYIYQITYQTTGLNPTFLIKNDLFLEMVITLGLLKQTVIFLKVLS